jgi:hypothetical protein
MHTLRAEVRMKKLNYFGNSFSKLRIGRFISASLANASAVENKSKNENPERKREITLSIKGEKALEKDSNKNPVFDKDKK